MNDLPETAKKDWFAAGVEEVLSSFRTDADAGLTGAEAQKRLSQYGPNHLPEPKKRSALLRFLKQFNNILIYVLLIAAGITFFMGHYPDTAVILLVVVINASIGFVQENRAEKAMESIKNILAPEAHVMRGGQRLEIPAGDLTPGDVVRLKPGDKIPADLRLIRAASLKIEEAALTGEAVPADKETDALPADTVLGDRANMAFSGTSVSAGTGTGVVVAVGGNTEIGGIGEMLAAVEPPTTPLLKQMDHLSTVISVVILAIAAAVYGVGHWFRDYEPGVLALSVIGLAIGAIPEGLPAIMSIILAIGVQSMAKRCAIVRDLPSVETLGSVSVICSDKTGTLTKNEMTVTEIATRDDRFRITGLGYAPEGTVTRNGGIVTASQAPLLEKTMTCFSVCNESALAQDEDGRWLVRGEPTEGALLTAARKAGQAGDAPSQTDVLPFDSRYKYMAVLAERGGEKIIYIKGAPDRILEMANQEEAGGGARGIDRVYWKNEVSRLAGSGRRTIAAAYKKAPADADCVSPEDLDSGVVFLGLAGIVDPPREEAVAAVEECRDAGITVKMITGDHLETALAIGCEMGIGDGRTGIEGRALDKMEDWELREAVKKYDVFARTSPENKLQLVRALKGNGVIAAMTGDGVNDAPALKMADVGIAMGIKGTEVTKEAAKIVLADDNFSTIAAAVEEGRKVYDNLKKTILFILPTNGAECFLIMASILFGTILPLTPVQILWVNMVTSVTVSMALAFEPLDPDVMAKPPRNPRTPILDAYFIWRIIYVSVLIGGACLLLSVELYERENMAVEKVRTVTMQAIVLTQLFHLFNNRSVRRSAFCCDFFSNRAVFVVGAIMVLLQLGITYLPFMNRVFGTTPLALRDWTWPLLLGLAVFTVVEFEKWVMRMIDVYRGQKAQRLAKYSASKTAARRQSGV